GRTRPSPTTTRGEGQPDSRRPIRPRPRPARVDGQRDRGSPVESRCEQAGQEAVLAAGYRIGDEAVAEEDEDEGAEHLPQVLFSPAFFGYRHLLPPPHL